MNPPSETLRTNRSVRNLSLQLTIFAGLFGVLLLRGWNGLDRIPSDPNYTSILQNDLAHNFVATRPYIHADTPTLSTLISRAPIEYQAIFATLSSHLIWTASAYLIFKTVSRVVTQRWIAVFSAFVLVLSPWAAQSSIGNYGGVRWPILVAAAVFLSVEFRDVPPRTGVSVLASTIGALVSPVSVVLLLPVFLRNPKWNREEIARSLIVATPIVVVFSTNLILTQGSGYSTRVSGFWTGASVFWISGQLLPSTLSVAGIGILLIKKRLTSVQSAALLLHLSAICTALSTYALGGIADRYFVAPAALTTIGLAISLPRSNFRFSIYATLTALAIVVILIVPTVRWFSALPWLTSGPTWSSQVEKARDLCQENRRSSVELITSNGETLTPAIPCSVLELEMQSQSE